MSAEPVSEGQLLMSWKCPYDSNRIDTARDVEYAFRPYDHHEPVVLPNHIKAAEVLSKANHFPVAPLIGLVNGEWKREPGFISRIANSCFSVSSRDNIYTISLSASKTIYYGDEIIAPYAKERVERMQSDVQAHEAAMLKKSQKSVSRQLKRKRDEDARQQRLIDNRANTRQKCENQAREKADKAAKRTLLHIANYGQRSPSKRKKTSAIKYSF
ncbi:hypothetical protein HDU85_006884 [Gaertneriomyces sp. JEL0708]|nr:hypothetical protein HDU85_006884 [Gaertneriomyces sp. JEL0708]